MAIENPNSLAIQAHGMHRPTKALLDNKHKAIRPHVQGEHQTVVVEGQSALALRDAGIADMMNDVVSIADSAPEFLPGEVPLVCLPAVPPPVFEEKRNLIILFMANS
eukprot:3269042-Amphidinium_carterae.1